MRFYVFSPLFFIRPKNTDWVYNRCLPSVSQYANGFEVYLQQAILPTLKTNVRVAAAIAHARFRLPLPHLLKPRVEDAFSLADVRRSKADVIYGHSPTNVHHLPLICHMGPTVEEKMRKAGVSEADIAEEKAAKLRAVRRSHLVTLNSQAGVENIRMLAPDSCEKIRSVPFFLPHLQLTPRAFIEEKFASPSKLKLIFVGRQARLKGLPAVLSAFQKADQLYPGRLELSIVSSLDDGPVDIPRLPNIHYEGETNRNEVLAAMRESHLLLMPSLADSYGWVYLEAMAAGAIAMACDAPAQQEIVADGSAGVLVRPDEEAVTAALLKLLAYPEQLLPLALRGWERVRDTYLPHSVAQRLKELGYEAQERFRAGKL